MPRTERDGVSLFYETDGSGETVTFVGEAGLGAWQWAWQYDLLPGTYRRLVWDLRGTGRSDALEGPYTVDALAADLEAVLAASDTDRTHLVGVGLGGMVALRYATRYGRARTLTLCGTASDGSEIDERALRSLYCPPDATDEARRESLDGGFSHEFLASSPDLVERITRWRGAEDATPVGFEGQLAAAREFTAEALYDCPIPALVCHGIDDPVVPYSTGERLAKDLPRGTFEAVLGKHLCFIEHARAVTDRLVDFLEDVRGSESL